MAPDDSSASRAASTERFFALASDAGDPAFGAALAARAQGRQPVRVPSPIDIQWADAELLGFRFSYDEVQFDVQDSRGRLVGLVATGHIGLECHGFWDEVIVESADFVDAHPFMERCLASLHERLGATLPESGSPSRNALDFTTLVLTFIDGGRLLCAAADFSVEAR